MAEHMSIALNQLNKALAKEIEGWHVLFGQIGYWLIGLHAAAGLFHHYWVRDNTLVRMLPLLKPPVPTARDTDPGA